MGEKTLRSYRVLLPVPPTSEEFEGGDQRVRYLPLGTYEANSPEQAVEDAAKATDEDWTGGTLIAVPASHWQEREVAAETRRLWKITKPDGLPEPMPEEPAAPQGSEPDVITH